MRYLAIVIVYSVCTSVIRNFCNHNPIASGLNIINYFFVWNIVLSLMLVQLSEQPGGAFANAVSSDSSMTARNMEI